MSEFHPAYETGGHAHGGSDPLVQGAQTMNTTAAMGSYASFLKHVHKDTGRAPSRCTDCWCLTLFVCYMALMVALPLKAKHWNGADLHRLNNGVDYRGRICGVDLPEQPYLFWCRADAAETSAVPIGLDLQRGSCVAACPRYTSPDVECLQPEHAEQKMVEGMNMMSIVEANEIMVEERMVFTKAYDTSSILGKYCAPDDSNLKAEVLHGPLFGKRRVLSALGSFERTHLWMILTVLVNCLLAYVFLAALLASPKAILYVTIVGSMILSFFLAVFFFIALWAHPTLDPDGRLGWYSAINPIFERNNRADSVYLCAILCAVFVGIGLTATLKCCTLTKGLEQSLDLLDNANDVVWSLPTLLLQPLLLTALQVALIFGLTLGFLEICSTGFVEDYRIVIDGARFKGYSGAFHYEYWTVFWESVLYLFGCAWLIEITISISQYLVTFAVISWYFMPKLSPDNEASKQSPPKFGWNGLIAQSASSIFYHFGSICFGAVLILVARVWRYSVGLCFGWKDDAVSNWEPEHLACRGFACCYRCILGQREKSDRPGSKGLLRTCCQIAHGDRNAGCLGRLCGCPFQVFCADDPFCTWATSRKEDEFFCCRFAWSDLDACTKDAYSDVIVRATDLLPAVRRAKLIFGTGGDVVKDNKGTGGFIGTLAVIFLPMLSMLAFIGFMTLPSVNDESSSMYVADPVCIGWFTLLLCMLVTYNFTMLFDCTADMLLYCYFFSKRHDKKAIGKYMPAKLRTVVGFDDYNNDKYPYYGRAEPTMYLSTFYDLKKAPSAKPSAGDPRHSHFFGTH